MTRRKHSVLPEIFIVTLLLGGIAFLFIQSGLVSKPFDWGVFFTQKKGPTLVTKPNGVTVALLPDPPSRSLPNSDKIKIAGDLADRIDRSSVLPDQSSLRNNSLSSEHAIAQMTEALAVELGSSELYAQVKIYRDNEDIIDKARKKIAAGEQLQRIPPDELEALRKSNPEAANELERDKNRNAASAPGWSEKINRASAENRQIAKLIAQTLQGQGFPIDENGVRTLCSSPDRTDIIGLAQSFRSLREIATELELRVRTQPDRDIARKYYATYSILLLALDKIQKNYIDKIEAIHLPRAMEIIAEAEATIREAQDALSTREAAKNKTGSTGLNANIQTCRDTIAQADATIARLETQRAKLVTANRKLSFSIVAARNTYRTISLQGELAAFMQNCSAEMKELESLSLPDMLLVNLGQKSDKPAPVEGGAKSVPLHR